MKYLIVNADDFGYSYSVNKGIIEAHTKGIVTSTSVMVDSIAAQEAAGLKEYPDMSVGLHLVLKDPTDLNRELERQVEKFTQIVGRHPDHIDTHKRNPASNETVKESLARYSKEHHVPVRALGFAKLIDSYFGLSIDGSGTLNETRVSLEALKRVLAQATDEYNELMCHAGYSDDHLRTTSSYNDIREKELAALTDVSIKQQVNELGLTLCNWKFVAAKRWPQA